MSLKMLYSVPLLLLASCAAPGIEVRTVEVPIEVPVSCVDPADIPTEPEKVGDKLTGDAVTDLSIVSVSALQLRGALTESLALLKGCVISD